MLYAPGETGVIKGSFAVGDRRGLQQKSITVLTKDLGQPSIKLGLSLEIPNMVTIKPGLLLWRLGDDPAPKKMMALPNKDLGVSLVSVEADEGSFEVSYAQDPDTTGAYEITVIPSELSSQVRSLIRIKVASESSPDELSTFFAHAIVR